MKTSKRYYKAIFLTLIVSLSSISSAYAQKQSETLISDIGHGKTLAFRLAPESQHKLRNLSLNPTKNKQLIALETINGQTTFYSNHKIVARLKDNTNRESQLNNFLNLDNSSCLVENLDIPSLYIVTCKDTDIYGLVDLADRLKQESFVLEAQLDLVKLQEPIEDIPRSLAAARSFARVQDPSLPNDPLFNEQWYLHNDASLPGSGLDADIDAPEAWFYTLGEDIKVAILDTGFDLEHDEIKDKIIAQKDFIESNKSATFRLASESHGTKVATLVAASQNNGFGISGVAPEAKLILARISNGSVFASDSAIAQAFIFAAKNDADIISNSWQVFDPFNEFVVPLAIEEAIQFAQEEGRNGLGSIILFASGNNGANTRTNPFTQLDDVITVASSDHADRKLSFSNFGNEVFIAAPSSKLSGPGISTASINNSFTRSFTGTSASTPIAAGASALLLSICPELSLNDFKNILKSTADKVGKLSYSNGHSQAFGFGRFNAHKAVVESIKHKLRLATAFPVTKKTRRKKLIKKISLEKEVFAVSQLEIALERIQSNKLEIKVEITDSDDILDFTNDSYEFLIQTRNKRILKSTILSQGEDNSGKEFTVEVKIPKRILKRSPRLDLFLVNSNKHLIAKSKLDLGQINED